MGQSAINHSPGGAEYSLMTRRKAGSRCWRCKVGRDVLKGWKGQIVGGVVRLCRAPATLHYAPRVAATFPRGFYVIFIPRSARRPLHDARRPARRVGQVGRVSLCTQAALPPVSPLYPALSPTRPTPPGPIVLIFKSNFLSSVASRRAAARFSRSAPRRPALFT